jgi:hypothetical protein
MGEARDEVGGKSSADRMEIMVVVEEGRRLERRGKIL